MSIMSLSPHTVVFSILRFFTDARLCWTGLSLRANSVLKYICGAPGHKQELDICSWSRAARSSTQRDCVRWCHHLCLVLPVGVLIGSCHQVVVSHWSRTFDHGHLLIASRAPKCRVAILVSTETAAKDALLLTSAKKHPTQFCFSSRLQWTSRFYVEAQLEFRTLLFVPRRAPVVLSRTRNPTLISTRPHISFVICASIFSVSGGSDGNLSYNSVSCA